MSRGQPDRRTTYGFAATLVLGAALRFVPIWFGLPYLRARPDEETAVGHAVAMLGGDLDPQFFHWPSLTFYVFAALLWLASGVRRLAGLDPELTPAATLLLTRGLVALAGTATLAVVFAAGRRLAGAAVGLLAALFLAVAILHVRESHFAMTDVLMTLLVTVSLALILRALDEARGGQPEARRAVRLFAAAGLAGGLATSTKYNAAAILAAMGAAQLVLLLDPAARWRPRAWMPSVAYMICFGLGFIAATPYALLDSSTFVADLKFVFTHLSEGHIVDLGRGWLYHLRWSLPYGLGIPTFVAAVPGLFVLARRSPRQAFVIWAFLAGLYGALGSGYTVFFRYILPIAPILCLAAAVAVRAAGAFSTRLRLRETTAVAALAAVVTAPALVNSVWLDVLLGRTDSRVLAARWLTPRVKPGESLHEAGGDYARIDLAGVRYDEWHFHTATESFGDTGGRTPDWLVFYDSPLWTYARVPQPLRRLAADEYVLVHAIAATKVRNCGSAVYDLQDAFFMPVAGFHTIERPGPSIQIYRRLAP